MSFNKIKIRTPGQALKVKRLFAQQQGRCYYCPDHMYLTLNHLDNGKKRATFDHIIPKSHGGTNQMLNGVCACRNCNQKRGTIFLQEFKLSLDKVV